jgi:hypothetical protein
MLSARVGNAMGRGFETPTRIYKFAVARLRQTALNRYCTNCLGFRAASFNLFAYWSAATGKLERQAYELS